MMKFLERIRNSSHETKIKWLVFLTILSMSILIYIWGAYFDFVVKSSNTDNDVSQKNIYNQNSFLEKIKIGGFFVYEIFKSTFLFFKNILMSPKNYYFK